MSLAFRNFVLAGGIEFDEKAYRVGRANFRRLQSRARNNPRLAAAIASGRIEAVSARGRRLSPAQRTRREQRDGVVVQGYHGTNRAFSRPNPKLGGSSAGHRAGSHGFWMTSDPLLARRYAKLATQRGGGKPVILRSRARLRKPLVHNAGGKPIYDVVRGRAFSVAVDDARRAGHDGIVFRNVRDGPGDINKVRPSTVSVVFRSQSVRTRQGRSRRRRYAPRF